MKLVRRLLGGSLLAVIVADAIALLAVAIAGAFVGYHDAASAIWTWRRDHLLESLLISAVLVVVYRRRRRSRRRLA